MLCGMSRIVLIIKLIDRGVTALINNMFVTAAFWGIAISGVTQNHHDYWGWLGVIVWGYLFLQAHANYVVKRTLKQIAEMEHKK